MTVQQIGVYTTREFRTVLNENFTNLDQRISNLVIQAMQGISEPLAQDALIDVFGRVYTTLSDRLGTQQLEAKDGNNINDDSLPASKLKTSSNADKIKLVNLADEVLQAIAGTSSIYTVPEDGSLTTEKYADKSVTSQKSTPFGRNATISDPINYDSTTKILSWSDTFVFGGGLTRQSVPAGNIDLTTFGNNSIILYFDTSVGILNAKYATDAASENEMFLGILFPGNIRSSVVNFVLTFDGQERKLLSTERTPFGGYAFISDTVDFNTTTKILSWPNTYVFGAQLGRVTLSAGSIDLNSFGGNIPALYFDTDINTITAKYVTDIAKESELILGVLWTPDLSKSILNFKFTINGNTPFNLGKNGFISDPINYDSVNKILSWPSTYLFGISTSRIKINAGSLDLSSYTGVVILFFNINTGLIEARTATAFTDNNFVFLGILWLSYPSRSILNFSLTINGMDILNTFNFKKVAIIGDSISNFDEWQKTAQQITGINYTNYTVGGTCLASTDENDTSSFITRIRSLASYTFDLFLIFGGTNDWGNIPAKPLGQMGDTSDTTIYGAVYNIINTILTNNPSARLAFITPLQRDFSGGGTTTLKGWSGETTNELGYKLEDTVNAIKEVCGQYGVPVLDLYHTSGITKFNLPQMTRDGLHPNTDLGMPLIGRQIASFIKSL